MGMIHFNKKALTIAGLWAGKRSLGSSATMAGKENGKGNFPFLADDDLMKQKQHGTCVARAQKDLRWACDSLMADRITCFNRHYAEHFGYFRDTDFPKFAREHQGPISFFDVVTGKPLFRAPVGRTMKQFLIESENHGWPSFRDEEVIWENVRCLKNGETVSVDGSHLGHNLPDNHGNRYCINLVSISGREKQN